MELENHILALTMRSMSVDEYTNAFTDKMEFALQLVTDKLTMIERYAKGLPWEYTVSVKQEPTFTATVWAAISVEGMIKKRTIKRAEVDEKRNVEGCNNNKKRRRSSQSQATKLEPTRKGNGATIARKRISAIVSFALSVRSPGIFLETA